MVWCTIIILGKFLMFVICLYNHWQIYWQNEYLLITGCFVRYGSLLFLLRAHPVFWMNNDLERKGDFLAQWAVKSISVSINTTLLYIHKYLKFWDAIIIIEEAIKRKLSIIMLLIIHIKLIFYFLILILI